MKTWKPRVARDAASLLTPQQADAIESLELDAEKDAPMAERLLAMLGITLAEADEDVRTEAELYAAHVEDMAEDGGTYRTPPFGDRGRR